MSERHFNYKWYAHEGDPNWDYYVPNYVCMCEQPKVLYSAEYDRWHTGNHLQAGEPPETLGKTLEYPIQCANCRCAIRAQLRKCQRCGSAYYNLFLHPRQQSNAARQQCWHCLEEQGSSIPLSNIFGQYRKCLPPEWALAPKVKAVPIAEQMDSLLDIVQSIDLSILEGL